MVFSNKEIKYRYQKEFNGNEKIRLGAAVALINLENQVLLEKRSDCGWWGITGGGLDKGENIFDCAKREIFEECGIKIEIKDLSFLKIYSDPGEGRILQYHDNRIYLIDFVFFLKGIYVDLVMSNESLELKFFKLDNLPSLIVPPAQRPLKDLSNLFL
tara:strand:+ start:93 stop:566 length:474 start_codon:yes stop_codon:yes gene_type:complete